MRVGVDVGGVFVCVCVGGGGMQVIREFLLETPEQGAPRGPDADAAAGEVD